MFWTPQSRWLPWGRQQSHSNQGTHSWLQVRIYIIKHYFDSRFPSQLPPPVHQNSTTAINVFLINFIFSSISTFTFSFLPFLLLLWTWSDVSFAYLYIPHLALRNYIDYRAFNEYRQNSDKRISYQEVTSILLTQKMSVFNVFKLRIPPCSCNNSGQQQEAEIWCLIRLFTLLARMPVM
jgi:hypothetical protein